MINLTKQMIHIEACSSDLRFALGIFKKRHPYRLESKVTVAEEL